MKNRFLKIFSRIALVLIALVILILIAAYFMLRASLPILDGDIALNKLGSPVTITRDANGTAAITARDTIDAMRALGFTHAQERFFEMDLTRRAAAGELSALLGAATIEYDKKKRQHRFRHRMNEAWPTLPTDQKNIISAYTEGVNSGITSQSTTPWQYTLLRTTPQPWAEVDSMLVMCEMFYMLQSKSFEDAFTNALLREKMGDALFAWMKPLGGTWDAAMDGSVIAPIAMPTAEQLNVRLKKAPSTISQNTEVLNWSPLSTTAENNVGSNAWAVDGTLTKTGAGMLANDMHLGLSVPNIWFRAEFLIADGIVKPDAKKVVGVTLPGVPALVAGSNGHIAWGFTNSYGKWFDWVPVAKDEPVSVQRESIEVKSGNAVALDIRETRFGPIIETVNDQQYALNWLAHRPGAINPNIMQMMFAKTVDEAIAIAQQSGVPHQNLLVVDTAGKLAWTIAGRMPKQTQQNPQRAGWAKPEDITSEWLSTSDYPVIKNPKDARLWTANSRQLGDEGGAKIGEGGFDLGARGQQIRDRLFALRDKPIDEAALYAIQLDTEARFVQRWATRMQDVAKQHPTLANAAETSRILAAWNGRADADQAGYLLAKTFRQKVLDQLWKSWTYAASGATIKATWDQRFDYPATQALDAKALHLLPQPFETWDTFLAAQLTAATDELIKAHGSLANATWGKANVAAIRHPLSRAVPALGYFLDMPRVPLSGDSNLPKVAAGNFGGSQRIVVSPGHEDTAIFTMPGGQSGHPLSLFYGVGHREWMDGNPAPLLAAAPIHTLRLSASK
jgi:penicillin G amidase